MTTEYTRREVFEHNTTDDCWCIIYGHVFDITEFMKNEHPGTYSPICMAGEDATNTFIAHHASHIIDTVANPKSKFFKRYCIGKVKADESPIPADRDTLYLTLKREVEAFIRGRAGPFKKVAAQRRAYFWEIMGWIALSWFLTYMLVHSEAWYPLWVLVVGKSMASLIAHSIHDFNHGTLPRTHWSAYLCAMPAEVFGSNQSWHTKHCAHHAYPNDVERDPDTDQLFRLSTLLQWKPRHRVQALYTFLLYPFFGLKEQVLRGSPWTGRAGRGDWTPANKTDPMLMAMRWPCKCILVAYWAWVVYYGATLRVLASWLVLGYDMAIVFTVSHNQVHLADNNRDSSHFLVSQTSTTLDYGVGSHWMNVMAHGLNHQVIHHLFPNLWYHLYPALTKQVLIPFCKKHNIAYHGEHLSLSGALWQHVKSLQLWGTVAPEKPIPKIDWQKLPIERQLAQGVKAYK